LKFEINFPKSKLDCGLINDILSEGLPLE